MLKRIVLPVLALTAATPALAETVSVAVPYGDLDLTEQAGREALDERLARAARKVCGPIAPRDLKQMTARRSCLADARASYQAQVELALSNANARRVAVLADKIALLTRF